MMQQELIMPKTIHGKHYKMISIFIKKNITVSRLRQIKKKQAQKSIFHLRNNGLCHINKKTYTVIIWIWKFQKDQNKFVGGVGIKK